VSQNTFNHNSYLTGAYSQGNNSNGNSSKSERVNLLEISLILVTILIIFCAGIWGYFSQRNKLKDRQKESDINQIILALDAFYQNSSLTPGERSYPIAVCSGKPNEVDYEYTLRQYLTGQRLQFDTHPYVLNENFPQDKQAVTSEFLAQREVSLRDCPQVFNTGEGLKNDLPIYSDENYRSCNFDSNTRKFRRCYLYTSSASGDSFELAYYSEARRSFVIYSKFRDQDLKVSFEG